MSKELINVSNVNANNIFEVARDEAIVSDVYNYVSSAINGVVKNYITIGYQLNKLLDVDLIRLGYIDIYDFVKKNFNLGITSTKNMMAVASMVVDVDKSSNWNLSLKDEFKEFNYTQLVEMVSMSDDEIKKINSSMSVKEIREFKKFSNVDSFILNEINKYVESIEKTYIDYLDTKEYLSSLIPGNQIELAIENNELLGDLVITDRENKNYYGSVLSYSKSYKCYFKKYKKNYFDITLFYEYKKNGKTNVSINVRSTDENYGCFKYSPKTIEADLPLVEINDDFDYEAAVLPIQKYLTLFLEYLIHTVIPGLSKDSEAKKQVSLEEELKRVDIKTYEDNIKQFHLSFKEIYDYKLSSINSRLNSYKKKYGLKNDSTLYIAGSYDYCYIYLEFVEGYYLKLSDYVISSLNISYLKDGLMNTVFFEPKKIAALLTTYVNETLIKE